jgi:hypothetical protein
MFAGTRTDGSFLPILLLALWQMKKEPAPLRSRFIHAEKTYILGQNPWILPFGQNHVKKFSRSKPVLSKAEGTPRARLVISTAGRNLS